MSTCLSQIYNDAKNGILSGFAKLELFPIWNLEKNSFVNLAYEAATVNIDDKVIEDTFYFEKHGKKATSYNRDMQLFPILKNIFSKIYNVDIYNSPTEMGVNFAKDAIIDYDLAEYNGKKEIIRRYLKEKYEYIYNGEKKEKGLHSFEKWVQLFICKRMLSNYCAALYCGNLQKLRYRFASRPSE